MATLLKGPMGPISGKVGNMVYVSRADKCYVKALPAPCSKPPTERQMETRTRFGMVMRFATLLKPLIQMSLKSHKRVLTGMNALVKDILQNALTTDLSPKIDYSKVVLSRGRTGYATLAEVRALDGGVLRFGWTSHCNFDSSPYDELVIVLYQEATHQCWFNLETRVSRQDETCTISFPVNLSICETHVWIAFRSPAGIFSISQYLGTVYNNQPVRHEK